jgi:type I restriction enzyme M protein
VSLADLAVDIKRGQVENRVARDSGIEALHTTDISIDDVGRWVDLPGRFDLDQNSVVSSMVIAEPGDILVGRVGRNFDAKIVGVKSGRALLTDCVYRLRCVPHVRNKLLQALTSSEGRLWLRSQAHGVSATQLTKSALLTFVI